MPEKKVPSRDIFVRKNVKYKMVLVTKNGEKTWTITEISVAVDPEAEPFDGVLTIPSTRLGYPVTKLKLPRLGNVYGSKVEKIVIGKNIRSIFLSDYCFNSSPQIQVKKGAPFYAEGNKLYTSEGKLINFFQAVSVVPSKEDGLPISTPSDFTLNGNTLWSVNHPVDTLILPPKVEYIEEDAFYYHCPRRIEVHHLSDSHFSLPPNVKELVIKNPEAELDTENLHSWPNLESVFLENGHTLYEEKDGILYKDQGKTLFFLPRNHPSLQKESFTVPEGVTHLEKNLFARMENLKKVTMPDSVESIGESIFWKCFNLESVHFSDSITKLPPNDPPSSSLADGIVAFLRNGDNSNEQSFFHGCPKLNYVHLPKALKALEKYAFDHTPLKELELPDGLEEIGEKCFAFSDLKKLTIPPSVKRVGPGAFMYCDNLILRAYEGTAKGLFSSISTLSNENPVVVEVLSSHGDLIEALPIPMDMDGRLEGIFQRVWDGDQIDWRAYAECVPSVVNRELQVKMAFLSILHLSKEEGAPYKKYVGKSLKKLGIELIENGKEEIFFRYLDLLSPDKSIRDELLEFCNKKNKPRFIALLLEQNKKEQAEGDKKKGKGKKSGKKDENPAPEGDDKGQGADKKFKL